MFGVPPMSGNARFAACMRMCRSASASVGFGVQGRPLSARRPDGRASWLTLASGLGFHGSKASCRRLRRNLGVSGPGVEDAWVCDGKFRQNIPSPYSPEAL